MNATEAEIEGVIAGGKGGSGGTAGYGSGGDGGKGGDGVYLSLPISAHVSGSVSGGDGGGGGSSTLGAGSGGVAITFSNGGALQIAEDVAVLGAGLEVDLGAAPNLGIAGATLGVDYDGQFGSDAIDNSVTGRVTVKF